MLQLGDHDVLDDLYRDELVEVHRARRRRDGRALLLVVPRAGHLDAAWRLTERSARAALGAAVATLCAEGNELDEPDVLALDDPGGVPLRRWLATSPDAAGRSSVAREVLRCLTALRHVLPGAARPDPGAFLRLPDGSLRLMVLGSASRDVDAAVLADELLGPDHPDTALRARCLTVLSGRPVGLDTSRTREATSLAEIAVELEEAWLHRDLPSRQNHLLLGPAGSGKSTLLAGLRRRARVDDAFVLTARWQRLTPGAPHQGIGVLVERLAHLHDALPEEEARRLRDAWRHHVGGAIHALAGITPRFAACFELPTTSEADADARLLAFGLRRSLEALQVLERPVLILLEDLDLAAPPGADLALGLARAQELPPGMLVVATARTPGHHLDAACREGTTVLVGHRVPRAGPEELAGLVTGQVSPADARTTLHWLVARADGNARVARRLHDRALRCGDPIVREAAASAGAEVRPVSATAMAAELVDELPDQDRELLATASCIGEPLCRELLVRITGRTVAEVAAALDRLCALDVLERDDLGDLWFTDRDLRELVHERLPPAALLDVHLRVATVTAGDGPRARVAAGFLMLHPGGVPTSPVPPLVLRSIVDATLHATAHATADIALRAIAGARRWLEPHATDAQVAGLRREVDLAELRLRAPGMPAAALLDRLADLHPDPDDRVRAVLDMLHRFDRQQRWVDALQLGLLATGAANPAAAADDPGPELERLRAALERQRAFEATGLDDAAPVPARVLLLERTSDLAMEQEPRLAIVLVAEALDLLGAAAAAPRSSLLLCGARLAHEYLGDGDLADAIGEMGLRAALAAQPGSRRARDLLAAATLPTRSRPQDEVAEFLDRAAQEALACGEVRIAADARAQRVVHAFHSGQPLDELRALIQEEQRFQAAADHTPAIDMLRSYETVVTCLTGGSGGPDQLDAAGCDAATHVARCRRHGSRAALTAAGVAGAWALYLADATRAALERSRLADRDLDTFRGGVLVGDHLFVRCMILARLLPELEAPAAAHARWEIQHRLEALRRHARVAPRQFAAKQMLVAAEVARLENADTHAMALYRDAMRTASRERQHHVEAMAAELFGVHLLDSGFEELAWTCLRRARQVYERWGAAHRVSELTRRLPAEGSVAAASRPAFQVDLTSVARAQRALSEEIVLDRLLERLVGIVASSVGARHALFLTPEGEDFVVRGRFGGRDLQAPTGILREAARSRQPVVVDDAMREALDDPELETRRARSILCMPVVDGCELVGLLHLENDLVTGAFSAERLDVLELLAAQISVSVHNARVHEDLAAENLERRRIEQALRASQRLFRHLAEGVREVLWVAAVDERRIEYLSPAFTEIWGRPARAMGFEDFLATVAPEDRERLRARLRPSSGGAERDLEVRIRRPDGEERSVRVRAFPLAGDDETGRRVVGIAEDVTDRREAERTQRRLEEELRQAQKMEAVGKLAGGIAHDFNNLLTVILGNAELLRATLGSSADLPLVDGIASTAQRAAALIRQLLTFGRRSEPSKEPVVAGELAEEARSILERTLDRGIEFVAAIEADLPRLHVDRSQVLQVLLNLLINARDAIEDRPADATGAGRIEFRVHRGERHVGGALQPSPVVSFEVADNGCGIDTDDVPRVFEPFFTTKEIGRGTGLGLSSAYGTVQQHGGWIEVTSTPGAGATFRVLFPAMAESAPARPVATAPEPPPPTAPPLRALVVDDEAGVREVTRRILVGAGHHVVCVASGEEALVHARQHVAELDIVVLDLSMPGLGGEQTLARLQEIDAALPVLVCTGFSLGRGTQRSDGLPGAAGWLLKPFQPDQLLTAVARCRRPGAGPARPAVDARGI